MEEASASKAPIVSDPTKRSAKSRVVGFARGHLLELVFVSFTLVFAALLQFIDTGNLWSFLLSSSYLSVGRNSYSIYAFPPPPGLFLPILPAFAVYLWSGYSFALANYVLKVVQLAALLLLGFAVGHIITASGLGARLARRVRVVTLLSPVLFFVSFIWVEQDVVGLALACLGIMYVLRGQNRARHPWEEVGGFGMLGAATFVYYFPVFLIPTLVIYSRSLGCGVRRLAYTSVAFATLFLWFAFRPGWNFASNTVSTTAVSNVYVYSPLSLFGPAPFSAATSFQIHLASAFVLILIVTELALPVLFRWWRISWATSLAFAIVLPFLFLNILNGDEFVWPLPFLMIALLVARPSSLNGVRLWLVQLYTLPMVLLSNLFDAPGPGVGSGIFYFGYYQFHNAVAVSLLIPQPLLVARILQLFLWVSLLVLLGVCLTFERARHRTKTPAPEDRALPGAGPPREPWESTVPPGTDRPRRFPWVRWGVVAKPVKSVGAFTLVLALATLLAATLPAPVLTANATDEFPVGLFMEYPVANGSLTYSLASGSNTVKIVPNYGNATALGSPYQLINFTRNVAGEDFSLNLSVTVASPSGFPYNTSVVAYGSSALNIVAPFDSPPNSSLLSPLQVANVSAAPPVVSPQFAQALPGALVYNGSSFARYEAVPLEGPGGQVTLLFRWSGVQLAQNVIASLYRGNVSYQLFGVGGVYMADVKPTLNGSWTFSYPRLVNPLSWHELTFTNASNGTQVALDGIPLSLPPVPLSTEEQGAELLVGSVDTSSTDFQKHDFWGTIAGPYNTTGFPVTIGSPLWCSVSPVPVGSDPGGCTPYSPEFLSIRSHGGATCSIATPSALYWLNSTPPVLQFGRLSDVGPSLTIHIRSLSTTTTLSLFPFAWFVDGVIGVPTALVLLARTGRTRTGAQAPL